MEPVFFESAAAFRAWLHNNHEHATELWVAYYKKGSGKAGITWAESVDQALCYGWIDSVRKSLDTDSYANRFTPRKRNSVWSAVNLRRVQELIELGLMQPAGLAAFDARDPEKTNRYSFEREAVAFDASQEKRFQENPAAWQYFQAQTASYRKTATWWVVSAKREETRAKRLESLIADSAAGLRIAMLRR